MLHVDRMCRPRVLDQVRSGGERSSPVTGRRRYERSRPRSMARTESDQDALRSGQLSLPPEHGTRRPGRRRRQRHRTRLAQPWTNSSPFRHRLTRRQSPIIPYRTIPYYTFSLQTKTYSNGRAVPLREVWRAEKNLAMHLAVAYWLNRRQSDVLLSAATTLRYCDVCTSYLHCARN